MLPVPPELPLQEGLEGQEARGRSVLESARIQARRAGIRIHTGVIRTRNPGAALVDEALRLEADMIYWSTLHAPAGERRIGPTALLPAQQAALPGDHRDRGPSPRRHERSGLRLAGPTGLT